MADLVFPLKNDTSRKIIHIDMDAFFASVEERDDPERQGCRDDGELQGSDLWDSFGDECPEGV